MSMSEDQPRIPHYLAEKSYVTLDILATGSGDLRERIVDAWISQFHRLSNTQMPAEFGKRYEDMEAKVTARAAEIEGEGTIHATVRHMDDLQAKEFADEMFSFTLDVLRAEAKRS